jgi:uncharacterized protein YfdQ (DUF2303 family)
MATEQPIKIITKSEFDEAHKAGVEYQKLKGAATIHQIGKGTPFMLLPTPHGTLEIHDMEAYQESPSSLVKTVVFSDVASFIAYVNEFKDKGSKIFGSADLGAARFRAILDYHISGRKFLDSDHQETGDLNHAPRWGKHLAEYNFPITPEWKELLEKNKKRLKQLEFAEMVERLRLNFKNPDGATMLELARNIEAKTEGQFKSSYETDNGDRVLLFTQTTDAQAGRATKIPIPNQLSLYVQPFIRGETYEIEALFRYRVESGSVFFEYELIKPHEFIDKAVEQIRVLIEVETLINPLFGNA